MSKKSISMVGSAHKLFYVAKSAYEQTIEPSSGKGAGLWEALVSIVFSAATLEAFINETAEMAGWRVSSNDSHLKNFAIQMKEAEKKKFSTSCKFSLAKKIFTGELYKDTDALYQDVRNLFDLRNALVHMKADTFEDKPKKNVSRQSFTRPVHYLKKKKLIDLPSKVKMEEMDLISLISTSKIAHWACDTAAKMIHALIEILPESFLKKSQKSLLPAFSFIEYPNNF